MSRAGHANWRHFLCRKFGALKVWNGSVSNEGEQLVLLRPSERQRTEQGKMARGYLDHLRYSGLWKQRRDN